MKFPKVYNPKKVEAKIYNLWLRSGFFNPDKLPKRHKKPYSIVLPPPNITGELHLGHALNAICQDILIRLKRLQGYKTLWLPGIDHAGIATQVRVERELKKEGETRFDLGKEKFLQRIWQWKEKYEKIILEQFKKLGCSLDWSRFSFTLDKEYSRAVERAFFYYYKKGLIYRGKRVVNWCPRCQSSLSDLEIEYKEEKGKLYYLKYPFSKKPGQITVATTRPETMFGDMALAVNPKDKRYQNLIGQKVILPLVNREIPIIADQLVDPKFGTGVVKITPAHDLTDYQISLSHKLKILPVIDEKGRITKEAPLPYQGMEVLTARKKVVEDLRKQNLLAKIEDYIYSRPKCYRCQTTIELIPSEQWFLKMKDLAKLAISAVREGKIKFYPQGFEKGYLEWLKNVRDWCISRQIWWGHKIPFKGVNDVLDTWFSSALWPLATLGWPKKKKDLKRFYPTAVLVTDRGIINLWVARMVFSGLNFLKKIPFKKVYIHPTVLTREGKRMSKSLGTGIDPDNLIEKYGADATRFGIAYQIMGAQDIRFSEDNLVMGKKFSNKIWNASRFVFLQIREKKLARAKLKIKNLNPAERKILRALNETKKSLERDLENFHFGQAAHKIYDFFWHDFCDQYLEEVKKEKNSQRKKILLSIFLKSLLLLHPFLPFLTEEIYQNLPLKAKKKSLMIENW